MSERRIFTPSSSIPSNTCRTILQPDILIAPTGISTRSTAAMIIMVMCFRSEGTHPVWF